MTFMVLYNHLLILHYLWLWFYGILLLGVGTVCAGRRFPRKRDYTSTHCLACFGTLQWPIVFLVYIYFEMSIIFFSSSKLLNVSILRWLGFRRWVVLSCQNLVLLRVAKMYCLSDFFFLSFRRFSLWASTWSFFYSCFFKKEFVSAPGTGSVDIKLTSLEPSALLSVPSLILAGPPFSHSTLLYPAGTRGDEGKARRSSTAMWRSLRAKPRALCLDHCELGHPSAQMKTQFLNIVIMGLVLWGHHSLFFFVLTLLFFFSLDCLSSYI